MRLHELRNTPGAVRRRKRVGRGEGGGRGKTAGRGGKGQTARSGGSIRPGFEGGQMPLYRKLPHRGFNNKRFRQEYSIVNVGDLERIPADVVDIDRAILVKFGLVRDDQAPLKVLGDGEVSRKLKVTAQKFSASAKEKIEKLGGEAIEA